MEAQPVRILLVEDSPTDVQNIREALAKEMDVPFRLQHAEQLSAALAILSRDPIDVILLDLQLPDIQGFGSIDRLRRANPGVPVVVLTASDDEGLAVQSLQQGAQDYLVKGYVQVYPNLLRRSVRYAIERKRAEEELQKMNRQNEQLLSSITSLLIGVSPSGFITHWNAVAESTFGLDAASMLERPLSDPSIRWDTARILGGLAECRKRGVPVRLDDIAFTQAGSQGGLLGVTITPIRGAAGEPSGFLLFGADITDRKLAEEAQRESEARYRSLIAAMAEGIILQDAEGRIQTCNVSAERILGLTAAQMQGKTPIELHWQTVREDGSPFPNELRPSMVTLRTGKPCSGVVMGVQRPDGTLAWISVNSQPLFRPGSTRPYAVVASFSEITDRKRAEEERLTLQSQLSQAQKMETIGRFAGGIAHDFENFLQVILGFAWLIRARYKDDADLINDLQEIVHAAESASGMVRQLLAFSRRQQLKPTVLEMNRTLEHMEKMLQQFVGENIQLSLDLTPDPVLVQLDPTAFEQIVMNLCSNARDSMKQGGRLTLHSRIVTPDAAFRDAHPTVMAEGKTLVELAVTDTGLGMDPSVAANIFEPFFTTKRSGLGTGLGLAVVHGLVRQHDGFIDVETAPGKGTTFHLFFHRQELGAARPVAARPPAAAVSTGAAPGAVLLIEPDARQRGLGEEILREAGYRIAGVHEAGPVVEHLTQARDPVSVVMVSSDSIEGDGAEFVRRMRRPAPDLKVLIITGHRDERLRMLAESVPGVQVLRKPYVPAQLLDSIRGLLEPAPEARPVPAAAAPAADKAQVLIVDDDESIRRLCQRLLGGGYAVATAASGREALAALDRQAYDLLLTDIKMPEMDGFELIGEALKRRPALKVLAMSGLLTDDMQNRLRTCAPACGVLRKPFTSTGLQEAVKQRMSEV